MQPSEFKQSLQQKTLFTLAGNWQEKELSLLEQVFDHFSESGGFTPWPYPVNIKLESSGGNCLLSSGTICLNSNGLTTWTIAHELAHALDSTKMWQFSRRLRKHTHSGFLCGWVHRLRPQWKAFWYRAGSPPPPCGVDKNFNAIEDFAESVTAYLYPDEAAERAQKRGYPYEQWGYHHFHETPRSLFIRALLEEHKKIPPQT